MIMGVVFFQNKRLESFTMQNIKRLIPLCSKNDFIKDTIIRLTYSGIKRGATCYVYLNGSSYRDAEGSSQLRSCIHDAKV